MTETRYARSGDVHIAYRTTGSGPYDVVIVTGYVTHLELAARPTFSPMLEEEPSVYREIRFDKRGTGMSDPVSGAPTLETRMDDLRAVMDAVGSRRAALVGISEGASMCLLFAATYPDRTAALVLRSAAPRTLWAPDYPWGRTEEQYERAIDEALEVYGPRARALESIHRLGSFADGEAEEFLDILRYGASPGMLEALLRMNREIDVRHVLPAVSAPTLVVHGLADSIVPLDVARYLAQRIPSARLVELDGIGHLALGADAARVLGTIRTFLDDVRQTGAWDDREPDRTLATVLFTDIVGSTEKATALGDRGWRDLLERHHAVVRRELLRFRGRELDTAGDGFLAAFDGPARAIRCACAVVGQVAELGLELRAGLHTGECEVVDGKLAGIALHTGARVAAEAEPGEVLVSSTVRDLVAGSGIRFDDRGARELRGVSGAWHLYAVDRSTAAS